MNAPSPKINKLKALLDFFLSDHLQVQSTVQVKLRNAVRNVIASAQKFTQDEALLRAASISYSLIVSFVPTLVVVLLVGARVINTDEYFTLAKEFARKNSIPIDLDPYINIIKELLKNSAAIGGVGFLILLFSATSVLRNIEVSLNSIFKVKRKRPLVQKISGFLLVLIFGPVLLTVGIGSARQLLKTFASPNLNRIVMAQSGNIAIGEKNVIVRLNESGKNNEINVLSKVDFDFENKLLIFSNNSSNPLTNEEVSSLGSPVNKANKSSLKSLNFVDYYEYANRILVLTDEGILLRSEDNGKTFYVSSMYREDLGWVFKLKFSALKMTDPDNGLIIGKRGLILKTTDGGLNWKTMNSGVEEDLNSIHIYSSRGVAIVGNNGTILVSEDSGSKFELWRKPISQLQNKKVNLKKITGNDSKMIIVGERGTVLLSDDAGLSWFSTPLASSIDLTGGVIQSNNTALLFGEDGVFRYTSWDERNRIQWYEATLPTDFTIRDGIFSPEKDYTYLVGDAYHILANEPVTQQKIESMFDFKKIQSTPLWRKLISAVGNFVLPFFVIWIVFFLLYKIIPFTFVSAKAASWGAAVTSLLWVVFLYAYSYYVSSFSTATFAVYGTLAAIPLTLLLVFSSAAITMFGAEIAYFVQFPDTIELANINEDRHRDDRNRLWYGLRILEKLNHRFSHGEGPLSEEKLINLCNGSQKLFHQLAAILKKAEYIDCTDENKWMLIKDPNLINMRELVSTLDISSFSVPGYSESDSFMKEIQTYLAELEKNRDEVFSDLKFGDILAKTL